MGLRVEAEAGKEERQTGLWKTVTQAISGVMDLRLQQRVRQWVQMEFAMRNVGRRLGEAKRRPKDCSERGCGDSVDGQTVKPVTR